MTKEPVDKSPGLIAGSLLRGEARRSRAKGQKHYEAALSLPPLAREVVDEHMAQRHTEDEIARRLEALAAAAEKGKL